MPMNEDGIIETVHRHEGNIVFRRSQNIDDLIRRNKFEAENAPSMHGHAAVRKVGSVPLVVAEEWARECGAAVGTREFAEHVKKKLMDGDFSAFRVKGV